MHQQNITILLKEYIYFIYRLFILFSSTFSFLLFLQSVSWMYKRDYLYASINILFYVMFYITNMMKIHYTLLCFVFTIQKSSQFEPQPPPSPLFVAAPLLILQHSYTSVFALPKDVSRSLPKVDDRAFLLF